MPRSTELTYRLTHALRNPDTAVAAAESLRGARGRAEIEGLAELICNPPSARAATAAIAALEGCDDALVLDALTAALNSPHVSVRILAVQGLHQRRATHAADSLVRLLDEDESWLVRRAALRAVADCTGEERWRVLDAVNDPHWRVRHALIHVLLPWGEAESLRREIVNRLVGSVRHARIEGLRDYIHYRWSGKSSAPAPDGDSTDGGRACPFWDWDAAVLARNLERMGDAERRRHIDFMPELLGHADERVRGSAVESLLRWGEARHIAQALALLDEPRIGAGKSVTQLLGRLDTDRAEAAARHVLHRPTPCPAALAWALDQAGAALSVEAEQSALEDLFRGARAHPPKVRRALARLAGRWARPEAERLLKIFLGDPDAGVQLEALRGLGQRGIKVEEDRLRSLLQSTSPSLRAGAAKAAVEQGGAAADALLARLRSDPHPHVRAAALTPAAAADLIQNPDRETSWHVLAEAARKARVPLWRFEPEQPWRPERRPPAAPEELRPNRQAPPHARVLGPAGPLVSPMGISGHYGLPVEGFVRAAEAGVNLLFWEPNYASLTEFLTRLPTSERSAVHVVAGTFEADGRRVRRDAERVLRLLKIDRIAVFLVFWVQSWARVAPDVRETLERLKETGKVASFGLSTHSRPLAVEAMEAGWNPVMVRHSAAHRGAESQVFPRAAELGASILTFNNTCYGRLLKPRGAQPAPSTAECYRYTLAQPGVTACWSAPATLEQLDENLDALRDPELPPDRIELLQAHGDRVYEEDSTFRKLVRSR